MPPSHLHPRSTATSALFAGTLAVCFAVVAVPHVWPCPRPRRAHMDSELVLDANGKPVRRVRQQKQAVATPQTTEAEQRGDSNILISPDIKTKPRSSQNTLEEEAAILRQLQAEDLVIREQAERRECPVPKPRGVIGRLMGFDREKSTGMDR